MRCGTKRRARANRLRTAKASAGRQQKASGMPPTPSAADKDSKGDAPRPECVFKRLDALDQELKDQIAHLEEQRRTIALLKRERLDVDLPVRAARICEGAQSARSTTTPCPALPPNPSASALLLMANLYDERSFAEVERISEALVERGLLPAMRGRSTCGRPPWHPMRAESEIEALAEEVLHVFMQVTDVRRQRKLGSGLHPCRAAHDSRIPAKSSTPPSGPCTNALPPGSRRFSKIPAKPLDPDAAS